MIYALVLMFPVLIAASSVWRGYVLTILWGWFVVPVFNLPVLNIATSIGFSLLIGMLTLHRTGIEAEKECLSTIARFTSVMSVSFLGPLICLIYGWIVTKFL